MKTLYLIRHAKSSWDDPFQNDFERPLNSRGRSDAPRMARRLKEKEVHPDLMLSSPAERAISTCKIMAGKIGYDINNVRTDRRLYHASEDELLQVVRELHDANDEVVIFAHNPGLTDFANRLYRRNFTDNIPTCGIVALKFDIASWKDATWGSGKVVFFDYPKREE